MGTNRKPDRPVISEKELKRIARNRLRLELGGLAFALKQGATPEEYARHFWKAGAGQWLKSDETTPKEYLSKEAEAFRLLYPWAAFHLNDKGDDEAEIVFTEGCLGGWGKYPWKLASEFGLKKNEICRYCREAFSAWSGQLGLKTDIGPVDDETCRLVARKA